MAEVSLAASTRTTTGSSESRRLRSAGRIPATIYGHGTDPLSIDVAARELRGVLNTDAGLNVLINLDLGGKKHLVLARELQKHPARGTVSHVDFQIVRRNEQVNAEVPITFIGEADKVTKSGGVVEFVLNAIMVTATPATMPTHIEVDISKLDFEEPVRVSDVALPEGVVAVTEGEEPIATASLPTVVLSPEEQAAQTTEAEGAEAGATGEKSGA